MIPCKGCWWEECGRCYYGTPPRNEKGVSQIIAHERCENFEEYQKVLNNGLKQVAELLPNLKVVVLRPEME